MRTALRWKARSLGVLLFGGVAIACLRPPACHARLLPLGDLFQVNTYTTGYQSGPQVAAFPDGGFVIAWRSTVDGSPEPSARARRFDASGSAEGDEFPLEGVRAPLSLAAVEGRIVVAYDLPNALAVGWFDYAGGLTEQRIADDHARIVGTSLATTPQGDVVLAWDTFAPRNAVASRGVDGSDNENERQASVIVVGQPVIKARRFGGGQSSDSPAFVIDATANEYPILPRLAAGLDGSFVVVWFAEDFQQLYGRRFDAGSMRLEDRFLVSPTDHNEVGWDICTLHHSAGFVVIWGDAFRRLSEEASPMPSTGCTGLVSIPSIACLGDNSFVVVGFNEDGPLGIRTFNREDRVVGNVLIPVKPANRIGFAFTSAVASLASNKFVVTWVSCGAESDTDCDIFGQVFELSSDAHCPGDCNLDSQVTVEELVSAVDLALKDQPDTNRCPAIDIDSDCLISVHELVLATRTALGGCDR